MRQANLRLFLFIHLAKAVFREGTHTAIEKDAVATIDGAQVGLHSSTPPPSGQIQITGFARTAQAGGGELAFVSSQAPAGTTTATGGFPIQVLLILGGMMGAVAVFACFESKKVIYFYNFLRLFGTIKSYE